MTREKAIKIVKEFINGTCLHSVDQEALETLIPELAESEEEKARKWIYDFISNCPNESFEFYGGIGKKAVLAYLEKQKEEKHATIEQVYEKFLSSDTLKSAKENKYIRAQLFWELMHNGIITEVDYQYLTDDKRKLWTAEEYRIAYQKGFEMSEQLKQKEQKPADLSEMMVHKEPYIAPVPTPMVADEQNPADLPAGFYVTLPDGKKYYAKEMRCNGINVKVVEPKPSEVDESTKRLNDNWMRQHFDDYKERESAEWAELQSEFKNINEAFEDGKKEVIANPEKYGLCKRIKATINGEPIPTENQSVDIPLAEWNPMKFKEGDKVIIHCAPERAKSIFKIYDGQEGTIDAIWDLGINPWGNIKVILPNGCNNTFYGSELELINKNEPKQGWSEEDELMRTVVIQTLETFGGRGTTKMQIDWLKSLHPSWKPSEDEERLINTSISFLKDFADKGYENAVECIDWLKSKLNGNSGK